MKAFEEITENQGVAQQFGPGPWENEPDKVQYYDSEFDFTCLIVRNHMGGLCGYVGIPEGHPLYGKDYGSFPSIEVHGGITYSDFCQKSGHICHIPFPGEPDNVWWVGFDCSHAWDLVPQMQMIFKEHGRTFGKFSLLGAENSYKDIDYVKNEIKDLCRQLSEIGQETHK
jgi:hypothetical protein